MKNYTAEELVDHINKDIEMNEVFTGMTYTDSRIAHKLTVRRLRDYIYKGLVSKPYKYGKHNYYTQRHVDEVIEVRTLSLSGYSDNLIKNQMSKSENSLSSPDKNYDLTDEDNKDIDDIVNELKESNQFRNIRARGEREIRQMRRYAERERRREDRERRRESRERRREERNRKMNHRNQTIRSRLNDTLTQDFFDDNNDSDIEHYITNDGSTYLKIDKSKVTKINHDDVEEKIKNCMTKINLTSEGEKHD